MLLLRGLLGGVVQIALIAALLIVPAGLVAGAWGWPQGWRFVLFYGAMVISSVVFLGLKSPAGLEARLRAPASAEQSPGDKLATTLLIAAFVAFMVALPLDVFVWQILGNAGRGAAITGAVLCAAAFGFITWVVVTNSFAIPVVEDQSDAGQQLVTTGPYAMVRHPMYLGVLVFFAGMGLFLQSWASLLWLPLLALCFVPRIVIEEATLQATLDGYSAYMAERRTRLLPGLW